MKLAVEMFVFQIEKDRKYALPKTSTDNQEIISKIDAVLAAREGRNKKASGEDAFKSLEKLSRKGPLKIFQSKDTRWKMWLLCRKTDDFLAIGDVLPTIEIYFDKNRAGQIQIGPDGITSSVSNEYVELIKNEKNDIPFFKLIINEIDTIWEERRELKELDKKWQSWISSESGIAGLYGSFRSRALYAAISAFGWKPLELPPGSLMTDENDKILKPDEGGHYEPDTHRIVIRKSEYAKFMTLLTHEFCHALSYRGNWYHPWENVGIFTSDVSHWLVEGATELAAERLTEVMTHQNQTKNEFDVSLNYYNAYSVARYIKDTVGDVVFWQCFFNNRDFNILEREFCKKKQVEPEDLLTMLRGDFPTEVLKKLQALPDRK